jgi:tetratricopeptide (TPR) repeat protein
MPDADQQQSLAYRPVAVKTIVGTHLEKILNSSVFKSAGSLRELLRFTVHETIAGRGDDLKEYVLGSAVLGKGESFDPKADAIVRVQMRRLREHLVRYYATEGRDDSLLIDIPTGTYTPAFRVAPPGGPVAVPTVIEERLMVGRQKELADLRAAFESAAAGKGRLFCLAGEPGIGKTTIVEILLRELATSGAGCYLARGRCSERLAGSEAYLPVLEALDTLLQSGDESLGRLMSVVAPNWYVQIARLTGDLSADRILGESRVASQERLKRELVTFLDELARRHPVVLFLDDLHWADASTVDVLAYAAARCGTRRILIVGAYRPADLLATDHAFQRVKLELQGRRLCHEIAIPFLTRADVDRYLTLQFPAHEFPPELSDRIHDRTEGNPLFMADLVRFLRDRGVFAQREERWVMVGRLAAIEQELPESIRSMVQKKIGELSDLDRRLMSTAAVQGQEFDSAVVARALEMDQTAAEDRLEALDCAQGFVRLIGDRELPDTTFTLRYTFVHVLYQNALHDALTATRRASLSAAVAQALMQCYQDRTGEVASQLALLFEAGRDFTRASDFFLAAAGNAARVYAAQEAVALARRAIASAEHLKGRERSSRVMAAAMLSAAQHECLTQLGEALADYEAAERATEELGDREAQVHVIYRRSLTLMLAKRLPEVRDEGTRAMRLAEAAESPAAVASSNAILAGERWAMGDIAAARELLDRAIPVLRKRDPFNHAHTAVLIRGSIHTFGLEHDEADLALMWGYERAGALRLGFESLFALFFHGRTRGNQGRLSDAIERLEEALRLAELLGDRFMLPRVANTRGWVLSELFDTEAALRVNTEAVGLALEIGDVEAECMGRINAARDCLTLGEPEQAREHLQQAATRCEQDVWFRWVYYPRLQAEMAAYWITRGDLPQAISCARVSLEDAERTSTRKRMAWAHKLLGEIAALEDRPEDAGREFGAALRILEHHACPTIEWQILRAAAVAAGARGDSVARSELMGRARAVARSLAESIRDDALQQNFLRSKPIRDVLS